MAVLREWLQRWALPQQCMLCAERGSPLCKPCHDTLTGLLCPRCPICAAATVRAEVCGACLSHPPRFTKAIAAASYAFPLDAMVRRFKYAADLSLAAPLADLLVERVADEPRPQVLIAMPLSRERLRERGFNQSHEIARRIAKALALPVSSDVCRRIRNTAPQAGMPLSDRRSNMHGAFACDAKLDRARVVVIDDVLTSGATLNELARVLRRAGAAEVIGWVVARA